MQDLLRTWMQKACKCSFLIQSAASTILLLLLLVAVISICLTFFICYLYSVFCGLPCIRQSLPSSISIFCLLFSIFFFPLCWPFYMSFKTFIPLDSHFCNVNLVFPLSWFQYCMSNLLPLLPSQPITSSVLSQASSQSFFLPVTEQYYWCYVLNLLWLEPFKQNFLLGCIQIWHPLL